MGKFLDKIKAMLSAGSGNGKTLTGEPLEQIIIDPPTKDTNESYALPAKPPNETTLAQRVKAAETGKAKGGHREAPNVTKSEKRVKRAVTDNTPPVDTKIDVKEEYGAGFEGTTRLSDKYAKDTPGQKPKYKSKKTQPGAVPLDPVYEEGRPVVPFQRAGEDKAKVVLGADKDLEAKVTNKQMPRRRQQKLVKQVQEMLGAGDAPMTAGKKKPKLSAEGTIAGEVEGDQTTDNANVYNEPTTTLGKIKKKKIVKEDGDAPVSKGKMFANLEVARAWARRWGGIVQRDEGTGKYYVTGKGQYSSESYGTDLGGLRGPGLDAPGNDPAVEQGKKLKRLKDIKGYKDVK